MRLNRNSRMSLASRLVLALVLGQVLFESAAYFATSLNLPLYLSAAAPPLRFDDAAAGAVYGAWGAAMGAWALALGRPLDRMGVRAALLLGAALATLGRALLAGARTRAHVYVALFALQAPGSVLAATAAQVALRRIVVAGAVPRDDAAATGQRSALYATAYAVMNVGALLAAALTERRRLGSVAALMRDAALLGAGSLPLALALYAPATYAALPAAVAAPPPSPPPPAGRVAERRKRQWWRGGGGGAAAAEAQMLVRLAALSLATFGTRSVFRQLDATLPKWLQRTVGRDARYGAVYAVNPLLIVLGAAPLQRALHAARVDTYDCLLAGTALSALAPLCLAVYTPGYVAAVAFAALLSAGEAVYSPRLCELALALSPPGREGVYGALAGAPLFAVKLLSGALSGALLAAYCPSGADAPDGCWRVWAVVGAVALSTPLALAVGRRWLYDNDVVHGALRRNNTTTQFTVAAVDEDTP